jgi:mRNA interferase MazF
MICEQGDIVSLNFDPSLNHEPAGRHYAVVISPWQVNNMSALTLVAPVTSTDNHYPLHVPVREGNSIHGFVQCEVLRAIDLSSRKQKGALERVGSLDDATMEDVMARVAVVVGLDR